LGGEKIDVAQWSPDTKVFIANALSPAKVLNVILQDFGNDKTAMVVVPDKQLSLAIGKEGQNARLAAKLTSWRIDIKSAVEAAEEALVRASASGEIKALVSHRPEVFSLASAILSEHKEGAELAQGELHLLSEAIELVSLAELQIAKEKREVELAARQAEREAVSDIDLLAEAEAILAETVSIVEDGDKDLEEIQAIEAEVLKDDVAEDEELDIEALAKRFFETGADAEETEDVVASETEAVDLPGTIETLEATELDVAVDEIEELGLAEVDEEPEATEPEAIPSIIESILDKPEAVEVQPKKKLNVYVEDNVADQSEETTSAKKQSRKSRTLEYDEDLGQVIFKRHRKRSRSRDDWEEHLDD
jgi:N utilization substance protein A